MPIPSRIPIGTLRGSLCASDSQFTCCRQCLLHRSIARFNLRNRIAILRGFRQGRLLLPPTSSSLTTRRFASTATAPDTRNVAPHLVARPPAVSSATTINAPTDVLPARRDLYTALERLKRDAANFVGLSRVELALRGLEEGRRNGGTVRVAVLAVRRGEVRTARRLVRLLLADPLGAEGEWERELRGEEGGGSVLVRYGEDERDGVLQSTSSLLKTIPIPSHTLRKHHLEILISSLDLASAPTDFRPNASRAEDAVLVPGFEVQASTSGRYSHMTYPVHKTLLVGEGIKSLVAFGRLAAGQRGQGLPAEMVQLAVELPGISATFQSESTTRDAVFLDVAAGEAALDKIRQSIKNAVSWEEGWFQAGIPPLSTWLIEGTTPAPNSLKPPIKGLIESVLRDTDQQIQVASTVADEAARAQTIPHSIRTEILGAIASWSEGAHTELRDQLDMAFSSKHWGRLKWYKLFWRVDDVGMITSEILERRWLVEAEKGAIYLSGRIEGLGFVDEKTEAALLNAAPVREEDGKEHELEVGYGQSANTIPPPRIEDLMKPDTDAKDEGENLLPKGLRPWPLHITLTRHHLSKSTIPSLQAFSQALVLQTATGTALSGALSALVYVGWSGTSLFEAGAILALGTVLSLRRLQGKWEKAREYWEGEVREEGRKALKSTEDGVMAIVQAGGIGRLDEVSVEDRRVAREAVEGVREAIGRC